MPLNTLYLWRYSCSIDYRNNYHDIKVFAIAKPYFHHHYGIGGMLRFICYAITEMVRSAVVGYPGCH